MIEIIGPNEIELAETPRAVSSPTEAQYAALVVAYNHFNRVLFGGRLPPCMITMQRENKTRGYFIPNQFTLLDGTETTDEIALNPKYFHLLGPRGVCSVLVHEMVHSAQHYFGKRMKSGYHDRQWGAAMKAIGLWPSSTGEPGGRETGHHMSHYIIEGGLFALAFDTLDASIAWGDVLSRETEAPAPKPKRVKFVCPRCDFSVQAVPSAAGELAHVPCKSIMVAET